MPIIPNPLYRPAWHYQEFLHPGDPSTPTAGINAAVTWLDANIAPPVGTVIGNTDGKGDVRLFWYGYEFVEPPNR